MKAIIIFNEAIQETAESGIYNNISFEALTDEYGIKAKDILYYIPLTIQGSSYEERKNNLTETAKEWQMSNTEFIDWSYSELATIQGFFEKGARRYGLIEEFHENGII